MGNITSQADFDGLLQANEIRYEDGTTSIIQGVPVRVDDVAVAGSAPLWPAIITTPSLASDSNDSDFTAENCFINFTNTTNSNNVANGAWSGGAFNATNCQIDYSGPTTGTGIQWPGFQRAVGQANNIAEVNQRYTMNLQNSTLRCSRGGLWTFHFQGGALTGHNLAGLTLGLGVVPYALFAQNDWVNVQFSESTVNSGTHGTVAGGSPVNFRFDQPSGINNITTGVFQARWNGFFGCDFRNWNHLTTNFTSNVNSSARFTWNTDTTTGDLPQIWMVDGQYSPQVALDGLSFQTNDAGTTKTNFQWISAVGFNPIFRDNVTQTEIADVLIDLGRTNDVYRCFDNDANIDRTNFPQAFNNTAANARVTPTSDNGYVIRLRDNSDQLTLSRLLPPSNDGLDYNYWSYTHQSYDPTTRAVRTIRPSLTATWEDGFLFQSRRAGAVQNSYQVEAVASEPLLTPNGSMITKIQAEEFATNGVESLGNAYAVGKTLAVDQRLTSFTLAESSGTDFRVNGTFDLASSSAITASSFNLGVSAGALDLNGFTVRSTDKFSASTGVTISDGTLNIAVESDLSNIEFGTGITLDGMYTSVPVAGFNAVNRPTVTFRGTGSVNIQNIIITGGTQGDRFLPGGPLTVTAAQAMDLFGQGNGITTNTTYTVNGQTITVPPQMAMPRIIRPEGTLTEIQNRGGFFAFRRADGTGTITIREINSGTTMADVSIETDDTDSVQYNVWYRAANVYGTDTERIQAQDYTFRQFQGNAEATGLILLSPNPINSALIPRAVTDEMANVTAGSLNGSNQGTWTLGVALNSADGDRTQAALMRVMDSLLFMQVVTSNQLTDTQRPISFGIDANGGTTSCTDRIILTTAGTQIFLGSIGGFVSGTSGAVNLVVSSNIVLTVASIDQLGAFSVTETRMLDMLNQQSRAIQGANVPGKGLLGTPTDVT